MFLKTNALWPAKLVKSSTLVQTVKILVPIPIVLASLHASRVADARQDTSKPPTVSASLETSALWFALMVKSRASPKPTAKTLARTPIAFVKKDASEVADAQKVSSRTKQENACQRTSVLWFVHLVKSSHLAFHIAHTFLIVLSSTNASRVVLAQWEVTKLRKENAFRKSNALWFVQLVKSRIPVQTVKTLAMTPIVLAT